MTQNEEYMKNGTHRPTNRHSVFLSCLLIVILGCVVYGNSLNGQFIWDDEHLVEKNTYIEEWSNIPKIFTKDIGAGAGKQYYFYRPFQITTYLIDHSLWKLNPKGYHLTNILLHIGVALSLYWLINLIFSNNLFSLLVGIFFVAHPIHTEAVTYISGRADVLSLLSMLLCFIFYIKSTATKRKGMYALMLLSYSVALLSKEGSMIFPVLLLLYHISLKKEFKLKEFLSIIGIVIIYILLRVTFLKGLLLKEPLNSTTVFQRLPGFFVAITNYIRLLLFPFNLHMEYGSKLFRWGDPKTIFGIILVLALLVYAFRRREDDKLGFFAIVWFFVTLLPVSNLYPINAYMAEHWLYLPSIGFFLIVARIISSSWDVKKYKIITAVSTISLLLFYSYSTIKQNSYWKNPMDFFQRTIKYAPDSFSAYYNLGNIYNNRRSREKAIELYKKAVEIKPDYADAYYNLADAYNALKGSEEAIAAYKSAIKAKPDYAQAYNNLGSVYTSVNRNQEAIDSYLKAIDINPDYIQAYNNLGIVYAKVNRIQQAVDSYKKAIDIDSNYPETYFHFGNLYSKTNKKEEAIKLYNKAIELRPGYVNAYINLGLLYNAIGRNEEAVSVYQEAIKIQPKFALAYSNLGVAYKALGKQEEAIISYKKAVELNPHSAEPYNNLGIIEFDLGHHEKSVDFYKKAIEVDPSYAQAYSNLAITYFQQKNYKRAIEYCDKAKKLGFVNPGLLEALKQYR